MKAIAIGKFHTRGPRVHKSCMICVQFQGSKLLSIVVLNVNVCAEKTFQLSWLIRKLFSLSLGWAYLIFRRHITESNNNNNNLIRESSLRGPLWLSSRSLLCSLDSSLGPRTQWIVVLFKSEGTRNQVHDLKIHELLSNGSDISSATTAEKELFSLAWRALVKKCFSLMPI